jgi:dipeptidyl aminopeptidase/acylaminoacyl peptidase
MTSHAFAPSQIEQWLDQRRIVRARGGFDFEDSLPEKSGRGCVLPGFQPEQSHIGSHDCGIYTRWPEGLTDKEQLRVEPARYDSKTHRFESYLNGISTSSFEFSRDRKWVAYVSYPDMSLWRSRVDGTDKMQLTFPPSRAYGPRWSPDGSQIAFMDVRFGHAWAVSVISSSGGPLQSFPGSDPNWLPEGRSIICSRSRPDDKAPLAGIFRIELESGKSSFIPNSQGRFSPRVSPDRPYIAAFSQTATELLLFDSKTKQWSSLAKSGLFSYNLWSPDGQYVYMRDSHAGSPRIVRVRIPNGEMEEVVSLKGFLQPQDILAGWFGLTSDGDPVVIRDRSVQEI